MIDFLAANWLWLVLIVGMLAMHRMHGGGCGGHSHDRHQEMTPRHDQSAAPTADHDPSGDASRQPVGTTTGSSHRHGCC